MATTMKAAVVTKHGAPLEIKDVPIPQIGSSDVLVKLEQTGVCHTDVHVADGDWDVKCEVPRIPGHEGVGRVVKAGSEVTNLKIGDRVGVPWLNTACSQCYDCLDGWETVCTAQKQSGFSTNGTFAQYAVAAASFVAPIPESLSSEQAAPILCAGVTVYKALKVSTVKPSQWVVILGAAGGLGHVCCQYATAMGMRVIAVTRKGTPEKEKLLLRYGVEYIVDLSKETADAGVKKATGGGGAHGVICLSPNNKDITDAVVYVRPRGVIVLVGLDKGSFEASTLFTVVKGISIVGSIVGTRNDLKEALDFAARGKVTCHLTKRKFEDLNAIITELRQGKIQGRVVIDIPQ